jgi:hypothetical protein
MHPAVSAGETFLAAFRAWRDLPDLVQMIALRGHVILLRAGTERPAAEFI